MASEAVLNDKTSIQLWGVLAAIPMFAGTVIWIATIASEGSGHTSQIKQMEKRMDKIDVRIDAEYGLLMDIRDRLIRLEQRNKDHGG